jgi:protein-S-isoprenylcysteine O-methyltransferase Ste14
MRIRERAGGRGGTEHDRYTRVWIVLTLFAGIALAELSRAHVGSLRTSHAVRAAGIAVMWLGIALRAWAIAALGSSFRTTVEVDAGQAVVSTGPYKLIRHPSYSGLLLITAGYGLSLGNWLSLACAALIPLIGIVVRIRVEESELSRVLGDSYRDYMERTKRLIPGVW